MMCTKQSGKKGGSRTQNKVERRVAQEHKTKWKEGWLKNTKEMVDIFMSGDFGGVHSDFWQIGKQD